MSWFKQWPKKDVVGEYHKLSKRQLDRIDSFHHAFYIVWNDFKQIYQLAKGNDLRPIDWNRKES